MRSTRTRFVDLANARNEMLYALAFSAFVVLTPSPVTATVIVPSGSLQQQLKQERTQDSLVTEVHARAGGSVRRTTVVGPRGNAASRTVVRGGAVVGPGVARTGRWVRPANYYWRPGGAIAAGAAIGFVAAASAAAYAGSPPAPGYCWYYSDPSKTQGFWDVCP
ncbi:MULTISPECIES: hypothetical protein [unclassified Bradyrhizobium]|uniref:hypothetical protein n=1 Tax=unclassified Bradyrhizobium TaxID=2631580 RepID=UPI002011DEDF|nr:MULTISPECIES: hypothetical protein [unclassified Bradyrhizobium]